MRIKSKHPPPGSVGLWFAITWVVNLHYLLRIGINQGGLYAVMLWDGEGDPNETIPAVWHKLVSWREKVLTKAPGANGLKSTFARQAPVRWNSSSTCIFP